MQPSSSTPPTGEARGGDRITIVSGLPRSGTSMMMAMLGAGGMPLLTDASRPPDINNPGGYFEYAPARAIPREASWLETARGRAVKVISFHLFDLPPDFEYDIVLMERNLGEVLASQRRFRAGQGAAPVERGDEMALFEAHLRHLKVWLAAQAHIRFHRAGYGDAVRDPLGFCSRVAGFLERPLDTAAMAAAVRPALYRQREAAR